MFCRQSDQSLTRRIDWKAPKQQSCKPLANQPTAMQEDKHTR